jgi:tetratricopeptide (TPR) repeat protein
MAGSLKATYKATQQALDDIIDPARIRKRWNKHDQKWADAAEVSLKTLQRFWKPEPIRRANFIAICQAIAIEDWRAIADCSAQSSYQEQSLSAGAPHPSVYHSDTWVERDLLIDDLLSKLKGQTRLLWLTGISGVGKTTLAECLAVRTWDANHPFDWYCLEILEGQSPDFATVAAELLEKLGEQNIDPQQRNDPKWLSDRLLKKLQTHPYWIQLDSVERLLNPENTAFSDEFWVTFLQRCLTHPAFPSHWVLTAQALPAALAEFGDRYSNHWYEKRLDGLLQAKQQLEFFSKRGVVVEHPNGEVLTRIAKIYEGHPLVLKVIAEDILNKFAGNVCGYWQIHQPEFEQVARELQATRLDETEYNEALDRKVRERIKKSLEQLPADALELLCRSAVFRRPVPKKFWLAMISDRAPKQQKAAYRVLSDRALIEQEGIQQNQSLIRQHNLIRDVAYDLLRQDALLWETAECKAAEMWLAAYEPVSNASNLEQVRGYLEAFDHYCEVKDWQAAKAIAWTSLDTPTQEYLCWQLGTWGYYREQIPLYRKLLEISRKTGNRQGEGTALGNLGNAYHSLGDYQQAINYHRQNLTIARDIGDRPGEGIALGNLGNAYHSLGDYQQAINYHQQNLTIARDIGDRPGEGIALGGLGNAYHGLGDYQQAIKYYQQNLTIARKIGDRPGESNTLGNLGNVYHSLGKYQQAIDYYQQSLTLARDIGDRLGEGNTLGSLGNVYHSLGKYQQAIDYYQQSLTLARDIGDRLGEGNTLGGLGNVYNNLGEYQQAINYYQQHVTITRDIGDRNGEGTALGNLGNVYHRLGEYQQAINYCQQSLTIAREIGHRNGEGTALANLGHTQAKLEQFPEALDNLQAALLIYRAIGAVAMEASLMAIMGETYFKMENYAEAKDTFQTALRLAQQVSDRPLESAILAALGEVYCSLGQYPVSLETLLLALTMTREIGNRNVEADTLKTLAELHYKIGQPNQALEYCQQALALATELGIPLTEDCRKLQEELERGSEEKPE